MFSFRFGIADNNYGNESKILVAKQSTFVIIIINNEFSISNDQEEVYNEN